MKQLGIDIIRATEAAAIQASKLIGSGRKEEIDRVASLAIAERLNSMEFAAKIVMSEGEKDNSFYLVEETLLGKLAQNISYSFGSAAENHLLKQKQYSICLDACDGTTMVSVGGPEAISVLAMAEEDSFYTTSAYYMKKLVYGPKLINELNGHYLSLKDDFSTILQKLVFYSHKSYNEFTICMLDRERHKQEIGLCRKLGVRLKLIPHCDVGAAIATCLDSGIDIFWGIGGASETILSAAAIKCLDGVIEATSVDKDWKTNSNVLGLSDLVKSDCIFVCTGITDGSLLKGVKRIDKRYQTHSVFMRSQSGTIRFMETNHGN